MSGTVQGIARGRFAGFHRTTYYAVYLYIGSNDEPNGTNRRDTTGNRGNAGGCIIARLPGSLKRSCIFEFSEALFSAAHLRQNAACEPARVFLQNVRQMAGISRPFCRYTKKPAATGNVIKITG
jgi:hypothetical protein